MSGTTTHMCISVRGALRNWSDQFWRHCVSDDSGKILKPHEVKDWLLSELALGHEVVPMDSSCDNFDFKKGCLGHPQEAIEQEVA